MTPEEVRRQAEALVGRPLPGVVTIHPAQPNAFQIAIDYVTALALLPGAAPGDSFLLCLHSEEGWTVSLIDSKSQPRVYWTGIPDSTSEQISAFIPTALHHRISTGLVRFSATMFDRLHDIRKTWFESKVGRLIVYSHGLDSAGKRTHYVLEVVDRRRFFEWFRDGGLLELDPRNELLELPSFLPQQNEEHAAMTARDAGLFYSHTGIAIYHFKLSELRDCIGRHAKQVPTSHADRQTSQLRQGQPLSNECLFTLTGQVHERVHFVQSLSTPCGLIEWRVLRCIVSAGGHLLSHVATHPELARAATFPFYDWCANEEASLYERPRHRLKKARSNKRIALSVEDVSRHFHELSNLVLFWTAFTRRELLRMRDFVGLANEVFPNVARDFGLTEYPVWSARDLTLDSYLPPEAITIEEMIEGQARLAEHQILAACDTDAAQWTSWRATRIAGRYGAAYNWLLREVGSVAVAIALIEIALTAPVDLNSKDAAKDGVLYVEDCLPSWRLKKLVAALKNFAWPASRAQAVEAARFDLAEAAGIPSPRRTLSAMQGRPLTGAFPRQSAPADFDEYTLSEIMRGLDRRRRDFLSFSQPVEADIFQPLLEIYADTVLLNGAPGSKLSLPLYTTALHSLFTNKLTLEVLFGSGVIDELKRVHAAVAQRLAHEGLEWPDLRTIAEGCLGREIAARLAL